MVDATDIAEIVIVAIDPANDAAGQAVVALLASALDEARMEPTLWLSFAAVAQALLESRALKRIPVMSGIMAMMPEANAARDGAGAPISGAGAEDVTGGFLAQAGMTNAYLHGYLTALAITPLQPTPQDWLGGLLGGIEFPGEGALDCLMGGGVSGQCHR